jgi:hypothetical protein
LEFDAGVAQEIRDKDELLAAISFEVMKMYFQAGLQKMKYSNSLEL